MFFPRNTGLGTDIFIKLKLYWVLASKKKINTRLAFVYYPNGKEMDQMVRIDITCNCIPIVRIAFPFLIAFLRVLIAYLRKYAAYLGCCLVAYIENSIDPDKLRKQSDQDS